MYKNSLYQQGQRWSDGCDFTCVCEDGSTGRYRCSPKSVQQSFSLILFSWEGWGNEQRVVMAKQCRVKLCTDRMMSLCRWMTYLIPVNLLLVTVCSQIAYMESCHNLCDKKKKKKKERKETVYRNPNGLTVSDAWRSPTLTPSALFRMTPATLAARRPTARQVSLSCPASARRSLGLPRPSIPTPVALWAAFLAALLEVRTLFRELQDLRLLPSPGKEVSW